MIDRVVLVLNLPRAQIFKRLCRVATYVSVACQVWGQVIALEFFEREEDFVQQWQMGPTATWLIAMGWVFQLFGSLSVSVAR
ncbi:hypothetical protein D3C86_1722020 [compost metagenome]